MKGLTFAFTRFVNERWIDREKSPNTWGGKELPLKDESPSGLYQIIVVPSYLKGRKVIVIPVSNEDTPIPMEDLGETRPKIYGIRTDCNDDTQSIVELGWEIEKREGGNSFQLLGGITGYESFYIKDLSDLKQMSERGWRACVMTKGKYDELVIPANQMKIVYDYLTKKEQKL